MNYAVAQFFQNGGSHAVVVRLYKPVSAEGVGPALGDCAADKRTVGAAFDFGGDDGTALTLHAVPRAPDLDRLCHAIRSLLGQLAKTGPRRKTIGSGA
jgi:hypothetical protein